MRAVICLAIALTACGMTRRDDEAAGIPAACADQADHDPTVRALQEKAATNITLYADTRAPLRAARARATSDCMRQLGLLPPGGVERRGPG